MTICSHGKLVFNCGECNDHPAQLPPPIRGEGLGKRLQAHYELLRTWAIPLHVLRDIEAAAEALATPSSPEGWVLPDNGGAA